VFEGIGTLPLGLPGLIISLGLLLVYLGTPLYNTALGILIAFVIFYLPYGIRTTSGALVRIHKEMEEAGRVYGAPWHYTFGKITLPLLRAALGSGFFYIFIAAYREVGAAVLLTGPGLSYGAVTLLEYYRLGQWAEMAAGSIIYAALLLAFILAAKYLLRITVEL
jgi:iron(III) transport system permease protein